MLYCKSFTQQNLNPLGNIVTSLSHQIVKKIPCCLVWSQCLQLWAKGVYHIVTRLLAKAHILLHEQGNRIVHRTGMKLVFATNFTSRYVQFAWMSSAWDRKQPSVLVNMSSIPSEHAIYSFLVSCLPVMESNNRWQHYKVP